MKPLPIIYVEDCHRDAELLERALLQMRPGSKLLHFRDAGSARDFIQGLLESDELPELLLVDINLPGMSGKDLILWSREQTGLNDIPIIAVSGCQPFRTVLEAEELGATLFIIKPPDYNGWIDLVYRIEDFLIQR